MKKSVKILLSFCCLCILVAGSLFLAGCGGNHLGIPNGNYFVADIDGSIVEATQNQIMYTIKGNRVTTHKAYPHLHDFNPNGTIKKASGSGLLNFDHFAFSYKTQTVLFGYQTAYVRLEISFDKETKILTVDGTYYVKGTGGSQGPLIPGMP